MSLPYNDAEKIAEVAEYLRNNGDEQRAAAYLGCRVEDLPQLGLPVKTSKSSASMVAEDPDYLWRADDAKEVL